MDFPPIKRAALDISGRMLASGIGQVLDFWVFAGGLLLHGEAVV
jgi:hypothetical protein